MVQIRAEQEYTFWNDTNNQAIEICYIVLIVLHEYTVCMRMDIFLYI